MLNASHQMIQIVTPAPKQLLDNIYKAIRDGTITTWEATSRGSLTYTTPSGRWKNKAWFKPHVYENELKFTIIRPQGGSIAQNVYAIYHGRFSEMLLAYFDASMTSIRLTALAPNQAWF